MKKKLQKFLSKLVNGPLIALGGFLVLMASISPDICMFPFWHNEAEMPESIRNKMC